MDSTRTGHGARAALRDVRVRSMRRGLRWRAYLTILSAVSTLAYAPSALAHGTIPPSLKGVKIPEVPGLLSGAGRIVVNRRQAILLGKALFWDSQVGSDGMACATCHYHAGTDARLTNQVSPGHAPATRPTAATFEPLASGGHGGPNHALRRSDFPLHKLADPADFTSTVLFTTDDVVGSAGTFGGQFGGTSEGSVFDECLRTADSTFNVHGVGTRRVTSRNAPSVINAVFNRRVFWDGRANNVFNGVNPFGNRDLNAGVWVWQRRSLSVTHLGLSNAALASQAVAPPIDTLEMSCSGRTFADIGRKLLRRRALQLQAVRPDDSVLGRYRHRSGNGLKQTYGQLIRRAFARRYWSAPVLTTRGAFASPGSGGEPYTQIEANFALFFGLAVQLYESTLIADQAPFDSERDAQGVPSALDAQQRRGLTAFVDLHCANCHAGPTLSGAVLPQLGAALTEVDRKPIRDSSGATILGLVDSGFVNTGVVPLDHDSGLAGSDPFGHPLSLTTQYLDMLQGGVPPIDPLLAQSCHMTVPFAVAAFGQPAFASSELIADPAGVATCLSAPSARVPAPAVAAQELAESDHGRLADGTAGAFKVPSLRNVELTGPYMHNGGMATLEEVLEFYSRGGNFSSPGKDAQFLFGIGASAETQADIVAFLKSLTDDRVRWERAPFDHPALSLPIGHVGDENLVGGDDALGFSGLAETQFIVVPAVGRLGREAATGPLLSLTERLLP
jgi:cytochrome c peroxidase